MEIGEVVEHTADSEPVVMEARVRAPVTAFSSLDSVNLTEVFTNRAHVMFSARHVERAFRSALRVALKEIVDSAEVNNTIRRGSCSVCCPGCFCSDPHVEDWCHAISWRPDSDNSRVASGCSCWVRAHNARWRHIPGPPDAVGGATMTMRPRELPEPCPGCNWGSCRQPDKLWRELRWRQAHWPRWRHSQTQKNARQSPGSQSALTWRRSNPLNSFSWIPMRSWCVCENPGEALFGISSSHRFAHVKGHQDRRAAIPYPSVSATPPPPALDSTHLPMWPPT